MDSKGFIDDLIASAKNLSTRGRDLAEQQLGVPGDGEERDAMLDGMGKGALGAGVLALLLGTSLGRRVTGSALKIGGLAAVGTIAYKAYQNWQAQQDGSPVDPGTPVNVLDTAAAQVRSELLLDAMVSAALADGHVDADELSRIRQRLTEMGLEQDLEAHIAERVNAPLDVASLAARVDAPETAAEVYLVSRLITDSGNLTEQQYLETLVDALGIDPSLRDELERQARLA